MTALLDFLMLGLEVAVRLLQPGLRRGEIARHPVEGVDEDAQLVVGPHLDLVVEMACGHRARPLGQHLHGLRYASRQVEAEPGRGEDDDEGHEQEEQDVDTLQGLPQELELLVLLEGLGDAAQPRLQSLWHVAAHDQGSDHGLVAADRHDGLDHVALVQLVDGGQFLPGEGLPELLPVDRAREHGGEPGVLGVDHAHPAAIEDRDGGEPQALLLTVQVGGQHGALGEAHEALAGDDVGHVARVAQDHGLLPLVERLSDLEGLVEGLLDLRLEPPLDRGVDEVGGDDEDQDGRREGQRQESQDELGLEAGAQHLLLSLEGELDEIAEEQDHEENEDDQVQVEEGEHGQVGGEGNLGRVDPDPEPPPGGQEEAERAQDEQHIAPPLAADLDGIVRGQRAHWRLVGVRSGDCTQSVSAASPL